MTHGILICMGTHGMDNGINYGIHGFTKFSIDNNVTGLDNIAEKEGAYRIVDLLGRSTKIVKNQPLFYIYDDGTVEKKMIIE